MPRHLPIVLLAVLFAASGLGMAFWRNTLGAVPHDLAAAASAGIALLVAAAQTVGKALPPTSTWFSRWAINVLSQPVVQGTVFVVAVIAGSVLWRSVFFATFAEFDCGVPAPKDLQFHVGRRSLLQYCSAGGTWVDERQPISAVAPGYAPLRAASVGNLPRGERGIHLVRLQRTMWRCIVKNTKEVTPRCNAVSGDPWRHARGWRLHLRGDPEASTNDLVVHVRSLNSNGFGVDALGSGGCVRRQPAPGDASAEIEITPECLQRDQEGSKNFTLEVATCWRDEMEISMLHAALGIDVSWNGSGGALELACGN